MIPQSSCSRARESLRILPLVCMLYAYEGNRPRTVKIKSCTKVAQALSVSPFPASPHPSTFPESRAFHPLAPPALTKKNTRTPI